MANRVTVEEVKSVIDTSLKNAAILNYIVSANAFVTAAIGTIVTDDSVLKEVERWMTAHMIASTKERQSKEEEAGGAKIKYAGYWGTGLTGTSYGQMAIAMDTSGTLDAISKGRKCAWIKAIPQFDD